VSDEQIQQADDPSGSGWRDVGDRELLQVGDMYWGENEWQPTQHIGALAYIYGTGYRRRIEQPKRASASDNVAELTRVNVAMARIIDDLVRRVAAIEAQLHGNNHSLQATVTLEPEWAADIDKFFVSRDAGLQHILRWYYRRAAERKAEQ